MASPSGDNPFWDFSVQVYGRDEVAPACLRMQDQIGADVNILMYCCWIARDRGVRFDDASLRRILNIVEPWKAEVVEPLRSIRRTLKSATHAGFDPDDQERLRSEIKRIELRSERLQQNALFAAAKPQKECASNASREMAWQNIERYLNTLHVEIDEMTRRDAELLVDVAFEISGT